MLHSYRADLHIHTCLSPCAEVTMSPLRIVEKCRRMKLDIIGVCDHNSAENAHATIRAAAHTHLTVLPGMEITSEEEVHMIALFETIDGALHMQNIVYDHLPDTVNNPDLFGEQVVANEQDDVISFQKKMLMTATDIPLNNLVQMIHDLDGIAIASHVDRTSFGLYGHLGFAPPGLELDAVELSSHTSEAEARRQFPDIERFTIIAASDAHRLEEIGQTAIDCMLEEPTFQELNMALKTVGGRHIGSN